MKTPIQGGAGGNLGFQCHGSDPADAFVFREPTGVAGGEPRRIELGDFLAEQRGAPEVQALLAMIGSLVEAGHSTNPGPG